MTNFQEFYSNKDRNSELLTEAPSSFTPKINPTTQVSHPLNFDSGRFVLGDGLYFFWRELDRNFKRELDRNFGGKIDREKEKWEWLRCTIRDC